MNKKVYYIKKCLMGLAAVQVITGFISVAFTANSYGDLSVIGTGVPGFLLLGMLVPFCFAGFSVYSLREFSRNIDVQSYVFVMTAFGLGFFTWAFPLSIFGFYLLVQPSVRNQYLRELSE